MFDYEKLGAFYLGKAYDIASAKVQDDVILYDAKDLTTHAVIVGMTGSGKTGLGITLLEEAAIDGIPALVIDPKGDLSNLLLTFPNLQPADFRPYVEKDEAMRKGMSQDDFAADRAKLWKKGLADWDEPPERIQRFRDAADVVVYTPGSDAGLPLTILKSMEAPSQAVLQSNDAMREQVAAAVSGLLTLLGIDADPLRSREHILLSNIVDHAWRAGRNLDMGQLIREIQQPPFKQIGIMDVESVFPAADRLALAMTVNNVLASPGFRAWTQGDPLHIQNLLYSPSGKPRLCILSIAHLTDAERMFFVTILLNEVISWMRSQQGSSSLRAILYMDEVFGYLPPTANPPSKIPMLTLLKQARAYGLGLVLATQNPVDLDYKALSNAGTWFLGRLQTERDKMRVLDGLEGASTAAGAAFDRGKVEKILSSLGNRVFLMNNVHDDVPVVMQTRWSLSYLRGPMSREQLAALMAPLKAAQTPPAVAPTIGTTSGAAAAVAAPASAVGASGATDSTGGMEGLRPIVAAEIKQVFASANRAGDLLYRPALLGQAKVHYVDSKSGIDSWETLVRVAPIEEEVPGDPWEGSHAVDPAGLDVGSEPIEPARFATLLPGLSQPKWYKTWGTGLKNYAYREGVHKVFFCPSLKLYANPDETEAAFRTRLTHDARESRDLEVEKLRKKYASKIATLEDRVRRAAQRVDQEKAQASNATTNAAVSFGTSILGALFGRKLVSSTNIGKAATSMRNASRASEQRADVGRAEENRNAIQADLESLQEELEAQIETIREANAVENLEITTLELKPRKSDTMVEGVSLLWLPYQVGKDGLAKPAFD
ncbi:ATP-binding protein [Planctomyces sp. SH-PL14]|uniref:ATP-binding protein n=1 Tax=Planctomyces sp. SH-PL14 TaxID=1632864 RepID=UPI00078D305D|nr:DUF87 domain-containing protein [Planctomyces sp. SH-PL14]AMV16998.1 AAA-like domain protein [Planctomyces sp. SH-PL14]